jgi:N-acetylglucosaminyldiphosphoundecaprenol N-acetyl-beta-D-mannosaminyltransferase
MIDLGKHSVLGIEVNAIDYEAAVAKILAAGKQQQPMTVTALAVHGVMTGVLDKTHNYRLNQFDMVCPDGQPVRWALKQLHGCKLQDRVYGPELTLRLCQEAAKQGVGIYLFGATDDMLSKFAERLTERFSGLKIVGKRASRFRQLNEQERDELAKEINESGAGICFVGLGCPRQEVFAFEMRDRVRMPLIAVGAAFAFHAGLLEQAPAWMQKYSLEWLFRLTREPKRLWRRYVYLNPAFLSLLAMQKLGLFKAATDQGTKPTKEVLFG